MFLNAVDRNKIRRGRIKARTTLLSQVIKDYDHDQFGLYFDGRKDRTLSMEDNRRKVIIEEHISLNTQFAATSIGYLETLASILRPTQVFFLSKDDKAHVPLGIAAANKQAAILMHMAYRVCLPDHDWVIAERHKLIPSVYTGIVIAPKMPG
ncbi:hypothetical protein AVEN_255680-1 [Araneus ventricosus]|uniref:Uncharacterized protein n=1 Tax=Araneus ventricosus TaxID=182803 RepID=A0A4Y2H2H3_ARAVE|nr:hypothetical protein AVEN_255680-1 [Araneus ventricosus]